MKRGDLITVSLPGDYGKPRPAIVVQADWADATDSVIVCLITSSGPPDIEFRVSLAASTGTGLKTDSIIMADKINIVQRAKVGAVFGHAPHEALLRLDVALTLILGLGEI